MKRNRQYFRGCMLGGAIGDALGWPVEFLRLSEIKDKYGELGITELLTDTNEKAEITDDTQMTLFTAEGILCSEIIKVQEGECNPTDSVYFSYLRWLYTQGHPQNEEYIQIYNGWLLSIKELHESRQPGMSCLLSLLSGKRGGVSRPINNSKGCGGVMRVAPVGLFYSKTTAFKLAADFASLTHGHPTGYLSAAALAYIIASIIEGNEIDIAVNDVIIVLREWDKSQECVDVLKKVLDVYTKDIHYEKAISMLGEGWIGEEALAIAVYCAMKFKNNFRSAIIAAVNHNGDSDSTGAITGNILGAYLGLNEIPTEWQDKVELKNEIIQIADDLLNGYKKNYDWKKRYPT